MVTLSSHHGREDVQKLKLTKASIEALAPPSAGTMIIHDAELRGFGVRVSATGHRSFIVEKKVSGRTRRLVLGRCDLLTVKAARESAMSALEKMGRGELPQIRAAPAVPTIQASTLQDGLDHYLKERARRDPPMKARTADNYRKLLERELADWMGRPPGTVTEEEVVARFGAITERGPTHANNVMRTARAIFNHFIDNGAFTGIDGGPALVANPLAVLKKRRLWNREARRTQRLTDETLPAWWKVVEGLDALDWPGRADVIRDLWRLMLLTGMRYEEAGRIERSRLDLVRGIIRVTDSKNREDIELPVGRYTLAMLTARAAASEKAGSRWLFPSPRRPQGYTSAGHDIRDILIAKTGLHWRPHDLRRTFASSLARMELPDMTIKRLMGHKVRDVTGGYVQHDLVHLREIMQRHEDFVLQRAGAPARPASN